MIMFETFMDVDEEGEITWRAYLSEDCYYSSVTHHWMPNKGANAGHGATEIQAIGNLCLDEISRIEGGTYE